MATQSGQPRNIAAVPVIQERLEKLILSRSHTKKQAGRIRALKELFSTSERLNLAAVLGRLFPEMSRIKAQADFRKFKQRFNGYLKQHDTALELCATKSPTAAETRHVWFEDLDPASVSASAGVDAVRELSAHIPAWPENPIDVDLRLRRVPCLVFPGLIEHFGRTFFHDCWNGLSVDERGFYRGLGAKFEPIRLISPHPDVPRGTGGFEMLALDEAGRSFSSIEKFVQRKKYDPFIHFAVMLYVGLLNIRYARTALPLLDDRIQPDTLFFTMNLSPYMPGHPRMIELLEEFRPLLPGRFYFEVSEKTLARGVDDVLRLREAFNLKLALDDLDELDPGVRAALEPHVSLTKIGYLKTKPLLAHYDTEPGRVLDELRRYKLHDRPLVVEAMDEDVRQVFLSRHWKQEWGALYVQGRDLSPGPHFSDHFTALHDYHITGGGYLLSPHVKQSFLRDVFAGVLAGLEITGHNRNEEAMFVEFRAPDGEAFSLGAPWSGVSMRHDAAGALSDTLARADYVVAAGAQAVGESPRRIPLIGLCRFLVDKARASDADAGRVPGDEDPGLPLLSIEHPSQRMTVTDGLDLLLRWAGAIRDTEDAAAQEMPATLALLGDTGTGKTVLARRFAAALRERAAGDASGAVPILIDAAALADRIHGALAAGAPPRIGQLIEWAAGRDDCASATPRAALDALRAGRALLIIDSLDTILLRLSHSGATQYMRALREAVRPGGRCRVLLTCRTGLFLSRTDEEQRLLGHPADAHERPRRAPEGLIIAYLAPLDEDETRELISNTAGEAAGRVIAALESADMLETLATRPFLAAPLARRIAREPAAALDKGPEFYEWIIELYLARDSRRHALRPDVKIQLMESLALRLLGEPGRAMHYETLFRWFRGWVHGEYPVETSRELETLDNELRAAALLIRGERGFYRFAHAALLEHCAARAVARALNQGDAAALDAPGLTPAMLHAAGRIAARPPFRRSHILHTVEAVLNTGAGGDRQVNALILHNALQGEQ